MVRLGQQQHVGNHARHALEFFCIRFQNLPVIVGAAGARQRYLGLRQQVAHRRAQFMRDVRREVGEPLKRLLQPCQHVVERLRQFGQLARDGVHRQALAELLRGHALGLSAHGAQGRQTPAHRRPAQHAGQKRRTRHEPPQGVQKLLHVGLVVRNVGGHGHHHGQRLSRRVEHRGRQPGGQAAVSLRAQRPKRRLARRLGGLAYHLRGVKAGMTGGKNDGFVGVDHHHFHAVVAHQRIRQLVGEFGQALLRVDAQQGLAGELHLARQHLPVEVFKMLLHRAGNDKTQPQQHRRGRQHKHQREALGERNPVQGAQWGSSST